MENVLNSNGDTMSIIDHSENNVVNVENIKVCFYYKVYNENIDNKLYCFRVFISSVCSGNQSRSKRRID